MHWKVCEIERMLIFHMLVIDNEIQIDYCFLFKSSQNANTMEVKTINTNEIESKQSRQPRLAPDLDRS